MKQNHLFAGFMLIILMGISASMSPVQASETLSATIEPICRRIELGGLNQADQLLQPIAESDLWRQRLEIILRPYQAMQISLARNNQAAYQERLDRLNARIAGTDPNRTDRAILDSLYRVFEYADEAQKQEILARPWVRVFLDMVHQKCRLFFEQDKIAKAILGGSDYLGVLDPNDPLSRQVDEESEELGAILYALRKSPCRDAGRFDKIRAEIFLEVVKILDMGYVGTLDYRRMVSAALQRCRRIPWLFQEESERLLFAPDPTQYAPWKQALSGYEKTLTMDPNSVTLKRFVEVFRLVLALNQSTLKLPDGVIVEQFADASLNQLDPYTDLIWPDKVEDFEKSLTGRFSGVGIQLGRDEKYILAVGIIPDSPASRSDITAGDRIVAVNGQTTENMSTECAVKQISGPAGTEVTLTIRRGAEAPKDIVLVRGEIIVPVVSGSQRSGNDSVGNSRRWDYMLDPNDGIGYIQIQSFNEGMTSKTEEILDQLELKNLRGLILDLRGNGGGLLSEAAELCDLFIDKGVIVASRDRIGRASIWSAHSNSKPRTYPLVILIDAGTASAAEIVAGALGSRLYDRAILVGARSYGKGTVQEVVQGKWDGCELKYTTGCYYLPDGAPVPNRFQLERQNRTDWGIAPHVEIPIKSGQIREIIEIRQKLSDGKMDDTPSSQTLFGSDPQLAAGLTVLKVRMLRLGLLEITTSAEKKISPQPAMDPNQSEQ